MSHEELRKIAVLLRDFSVLHEAPDRTQRDLALVAAKYLEQELDEPTEFK